MEEGIVKIGDYGLAKLITPGQATGHSESIGTCHYMAPEIASGKYHKPIDIYAIGVILYEMLTGRVPFEGETVGEILMKHLTARPDLSQLPEPFKSIVAKALAKDPSQRPSRVHDLLPPEDAPAKPGVRFIGDGKVAAAPTAAVSRKPRGRGAILRIAGRGAGLLHRARDPPAAPGGRSRGGSGRWTSAALWDRDRRRPAGARGPSARPDSAPRRSRAAGSGSRSWRPRCSGPPR